MNLKKQLKNPSFLKNIKDLYAIKVALSNCIFVDNDFFEKIAFELPLTASGQKLFKFLKKQNKGCKEDLIRLAIFIDFYHEELYVDVLSTDVSSIQNQFSDWITKNKIKFPWIYGRELYDKYFKEFEDQSSELDFDQTLKLLDKTSKGVFQIKTSIIGPYGLLKSKSERDIRPEIKLPLWHCPDPSCNTFHITGFNNSDNKLFEVLSNVAMYNSGKSPLDMSKIIDADEDEDEHYNAYSLNGLFELLVNTFGVEENRMILQKLIEKENIRDFLPLNLKRGQAKDLVKNLRKDECINLILICEDEKILLQLELLIDEGLIVIPATEIRESMITRNFGQYETFLQCNQLGIRVGSKYTELSMVKLKRLLKDVYNESPQREELEWKLRKYPKTFNLDQKLSQYILEENPFKIIQETILNGPVQLDKTFKILPGLFQIPNDFDSEKVLIDKIAWKIGYNINLYPTFLNVFWKNLELFKTDVLSSLKYNENDKAKIRSSAVNLFVSIEEILQQSLSFITWALLSDHYLKTKFKFVYEDARDFMVKRLNNFEYSNGELLKFDTSGKNTLFPLITGFSALTKICDKLIESQDEKYKRPKQELPFFYQKDPLRLFPFEHRIFVLDIFPSDYQSIKEIIDTIPSELNKGDIMNIRNRLQHKRDDFPIQEEIVSSISAIEKCFAMLENEGLYPDVYLHKSTQLDEFKRTKFSLVNYKGKEFQYYSTPELIGSKTPNSVNPLITIPSIKIGLTNRPITFEYMEKSKYQTYWKDYPKKKGFE